jgi:uncharacterized phage protein (predicted DNA packaging)
MITLAELKAQLRLNADDDSEDNLLQIYIEAAASKLQVDLNRTVLASQAEYDAVNQDPLVDTTDMVLTPNIRLALLLLAGHFYANREATSEVALTEVPLAYEALITPYRIINL